MESPESSLDRLKTKIDLERGKSLVMIVTVIVVERLKERSGS